MKVANKIFLSLLILFFSKLLVAGSIVQVGSAKTNGVLHTTYDSNSLSINTDSSTPCDAQCWRERYYLLEKKKLENRQKRFEKRQAEKEKRYQDAMNRARENKRLQLLQKAKKRCENEDMNSVSFAERNICNAVNGYFSYGIPVPDSMLGLSQ